MFFNDIKLSDTKFSGINFFFFLLLKEINRDPASNRALHSRHSYRAMVPLIYRCNDWIRHKETPDTGTCLFPGFLITAGNSNLISIKTSDFESELVLRKTRVYYACQSDNLSAWRQLPFLEPYKAAAPPPNSLHPTLGCRT